MARSRNSKIIFADQPKAQTRSCEWPGCAEHGDFPAPRSRAALRQYRWFCLQHVRQYNAAWDFYAGMSAEQIEAHIRADSTWRRPSWPLGTRPRGVQGFVWDKASDPLGLIEDPELFGSQRAGSDGRAPPDMTPAQQQAMNVMEVVWPVTLQELHSRYKELVKQHHPDAHGGDKLEEERLKAVNLAYSTLKQYLSA
jgi:DnaJ-domain-containing protein 1